MAFGEQQLLYGFLSQCNDLKIGDLCTLCSHRNNAAGPENGKMITKTEMMDVLKESLPRINSHSRFVKTMTTLCQTYHVFDSCIRNGRKKMLFYIFFRIALFRILRIFHESLF